MLLWTCYNRKKVNISFSAAILSHKGSMHLYMGSRKVKKAKELKVKDFEHFEFMQLLVPI
jgi:hypothetical protein